MATVKEVVRDILGSVDTDVAFLQCVKWVENRWQQMHNRVKFKANRRIGELSLSAKYTTGTIDVTNASTAVSGTDTEWATTPGSGAQTDWWIRIGSTWYEIASVTDDTNLVLSTAFVGDTDTDLSYTIIRRYYQLEYEARSLSTFALPRLRLFLENYSMEQLDREAPGRDLAGGFPIVWAEMDYSTTLYRRVELYPYSTNAEIVQYVYYKSISSTTMASTIDPHVDPYMLKEGVLIDLYRFLKAKAYKANRIDEGNSWRNDEMAQQTRWDRIIQEAKKADRGIDDASFLLKTLVSGPNRSGTITDAHDYVYSRWSRP